VASERDGGRIEVEDGLLAAGFVQLPILLARDPNLTAGAKLVYVALLWYYWRGQDYPGQQQLAEDFGMSARSAWAYLKELERESYLESKRPGRGQPNILILRTLRPADGGQDRPLFSAPSSTPAPRLVQTAEPPLRGPAAIPVQTRKFCESRLATSANPDSQNLPKHIEQQDSVSTRTESESAAGAGSTQSQPASDRSESDFAEAIRQTATALNCAKETKQLITLAQAERWPEDLIRTAGRVVGQAIAAGAQVRKPGAYLTTAVRVMLSDRQQAAEAGKRKVADRRQDALAYARQIYSDPIIGGNWRQVEAILRESYGQQVAAWVAEQLQGS
jgi:hypothetical protein